MTREEELKKQGWEKRFTIDEPRLSEIVEQYKELGFEVLLEPVDTSSEECTTCITASHATKPSTPAKEVNSYAFIWNPTSLIMVRSSSAFRPGVVR
jgi:hypothetical protein